MAAWYDDKQGDGGDLWHRALIDPALLQVLGSVSGERVLDFACGNGYLARRVWGAARSPACVTIQPRGPSRPTAGSNGATRTSDSSAAGMAPSHATVTA
jgi:hypothetical protein